MKPIWSIEDIDLAPKPGKKYWKNCHREWREEFIYFLLIDRFHDSLTRKPESTNNRIGFGEGEQLKQFCGGSIKGITNNLEYISSLGCTALWLSPLFENNPESYHGYAIQNYLQIDKRFGTKEDLEELVEAAHKRDMRVFLDVVLHHSGDNWYYPNDDPYYYYNGATFPLAGWRSEDHPIPIELRDPELYGRKGQIRNYDAYPETREGDFQTLKAFRMDNSREARYVQDLLIGSHCYWIKEVDIDGFRLDAVKHMGEEAISRFCSHIREYSYSLGKKNFFLFGELVGSEEIYNRYIGPKTTVSVDDQNIYYGLNSVLDFPLYHVLADVIKGKASPERLIERYQSLHDNALGRGEFGEFLVTFIDNHDQVGQSFKHRFGKDATEEQVIAGVGFLLCALGTPCIYYGTEQGFAGSGENDSCIREAMFCLQDKVTNSLNTSSKIYKCISEIAEIRKHSSILKFGHMHMRKISTDGKYFHLPECEKCLIAFSRVLFDQEIVVAFNSSPTEEREEYVTVKQQPIVKKHFYKFLFGDVGEVRVFENIDGSRHFVKLKLRPMQFVMLSNV
ncbi:MAG: neopullulanase [Cytophagales bacterium]|jgi:alpha-amylase|nr:alpha-amylase [Bacteroidota bacterium]MBS1950740.1 alpha-amylase [Bacteroidota bacterium]MBS1980700.1 alpha-amylase [Bacteroidota bacterium]WHZ08033.1 MAG: neopullulanase [Cytophagales bacterium]